MSPLEDKIHAAARKRQAAWAIGDRELTDQIGNELERLYAKLRDKRKNDPGASFAGRSASFVSPPTRSPRPWRVAR